MGYPRKFSESTDCILIIPGNRKKNICNNLYFKTFNFNNFDTVQSSQFLDSINSKIQYYEIQFILAKLNRLSKYIIHLYPIKITLSISLIKITLHLLVINENFYWPPIQTAIISYTQGRSFE